MQLAQAKRRETLTTFGIYYDDDYDYEQHLRDVDEINKVEPDRDVELFRVGATAKVCVVLQSVGHGPCGYRVLGVIIGYYLAYFPCSRC